MVRFDGTRNTRGKHGARVLTDETREGAGVARGRRGIIGTGRPDSGHMEPPWDKCFFRWVLEGNHAMVRAHSGLRVRVAGGRRGITQ